jgi:hypothetical protein
VRDLRRLYKIDPADEPGIPVPVNHPSAFNGGTPRGSRTPAGLLSGGTDSPMPGTGGRTRHRDPGPGINGGGPSRVPPVPRLPLLADYGGGGPGLAYHDQGAGGRGTPAGGDGGVAAFPSPIREPRTASGRAAGGGGGPGASGGTRISGEEAGGYALCNPRSTVGESYVRRKGP